MTQTNPSLTPAQHLRLLGRLAQPLLLILAHGLDQVGESLLSELTGQNNETCRKTLRELARYGYLEREEYHRGYRVLLAAYAVIPEMSPVAKARLAAARGQVTSMRAQEALPAAQRAESRFLDSAQAQKTAFPRKTTRGKAAANRGISAFTRENPASHPDVINVNVVDELFLKLLKRIPTTTTDSEALKNAVFGGNARLPGSGSVGRGAQATSAWPGDSAEAGSLNETEDSDETGSELSARSEEEIEQAWAKLRLCGISEPKRSELLALDCVTQEFIQAWCETLDNAPGPGKWTPGLLITCMEKEEWPVGKRSVERSRQSYTEGEFADFIDH